MYHAWARIFMNVLLVSGRGMCLSLGLKCLYFSLSSYSCCGSPLRSCFPLAPHMQGPVSSYVLRQHHVLEPSTDFTCLCVHLMACPYIWYVYSPGEGRGLPLPATCLYLLVFVKWMDRVGWLHREQPSFSALLQLSVQGSVSLQGPWGGSLHEDDGTFWRIYIVTWIALRCDLRKTSQLEERGSVS